MKNARQTMILDIINHVNVETQDELARELVANGIKVTQATISRDIRELNIIKIGNGEGGYKYATSESADSNRMNDRFVRIFIDSVLSVSYANNIIVLHTLAGSANAAAEAIDSMHLPEILGTMAGDNTILVIVRNNDEAPQVVARFKEIIN